jgi:hypothetical protein
MATNVISGDPEILQLRKIETEARKVLEMSNPPSVKQLDSALRSLEYVKKEFQRIWFTY